MDLRWVATRYSGGGQNDGVWTRRIKDSKVYWVGVNGGTETIRWGELLTLPVNAPGDCIIEANMRLKTGGGTANFGIGFNGNVGYVVNYGVELNAGVTTTYKLGRWGGATIPLPGFPSHTYIGPLPVDIISNIRVVRKNNYLFFYIDNQYVGQGAYAALITSVAIFPVWLTGSINNEMWVDYISVDPGSVVLGGP